MFIFKNELISYLDLFNLFIPLSLPSCDNPIGKNSLLPEWGKIKKLVKLLTTTKQLTTHTLANNIAYKQMWIR